MPLALLVLGLALAVLIGLSLGLLGGGGSILTLPILVYVLGQETHQAIATSLLVVGATSLAALVPHARQHRVRWRTGLLFGATSMIGAFAAGRVAHYVPGVVLLLAFGAMMIVTAGAMMRRTKHRAPRPSTDAKTRYAHIVIQGLAVGAGAGLIGAGGGFLVVPALVLLGGLPMREAIGTSLLVITMSSLAAFAGHVGATHVDLGLAAMVTGAAIAGSFVGAALAGRLPEELLRRGFAWFVVVMAVFLLAQEGPRALGYDVALSRDWPWILGAALVPFVIGALDLARMRIGERNHAALDRRRAHAS